MICWNQPNASSIRLQCLTEYRDHPTNSTLYFLKLCFYESLTGQGNIDVIVVYPDDKFQSRLPWFFVQLFRLTLDLEVTFLVINSCLDFLGSLYNSLDLL